MMAEPAQGYHADMRLPALLAVLVLSVALRLAYDLFVPPSNPYSLTPLIGA